MFTPSTSLLTPGKENTVEQSKVELDPALVGSATLNPLSGGSPARGIMFPDAKSAEATRAIVEIDPAKFKDVAKYAVRIKVQSDAVRLYLGLDKINTEHLQHSTGQITWGWSTDEHLMTLTCDLDTYTVETRDALTGVVLQTAEYGYDNKPLQDMIAQNTPEGGFVVTDQYGGNVARREPKVRKPIPAFKLSQFPGISHR
jgi:hypothetical protein